MSDSFNDIQISSLQELYNVLDNELLDFVNSEWKPDHKLYYRGQADISYDVRSTIMREHKMKGFQRTENGKVTVEDFDIESDGLYIFEADMIREVIKNYPHDFQNLSHLQILSKMRHHGLPTRLIDVTSSPLIAAFFACNDINKREKDGAIYIFYDKPYLQDEKFVDDTLGWSFKHRDGKPQAPSFIIDAYYEHTRIKAQQGAFIWEREPKDTAELATPIRIIIPSLSKKHIMWQLDKAGINLLSLFPDLDNAILNIKEKYVQKFATETRCIVPILDGTDL